MQGIFSTAKLKVARRKPVTDLILVIFAGCLFIACQDKQQQAKQLINEANALLNQDTNITAEWTEEYRNAFRPENLANFPANRASLQARADKILTLLGESEILNNQITEKFEQAAAIMTTDDGRRGLSLFAASTRKAREINELFKQQMRLVSDEQIQDQKTLSERLKQVMAPLPQIKAEKDKLDSEAKKLMRL